MKTFTLSPIIVPAARGPVELKLTPNLTITTSGRIKKSTWDRLDRYFLLWLSPIVAIITIVYIAGFVHILVFSNDLDFELKWYDKPAYKLLKVLSADMSTIDPDQTLKID